MAVDLGDHVGSLQRAVTPLGVAVSSSIPDSMWTAYLTDAFWEARLDGFMRAYTADEDGIVTPVREDDPDLPREWISLIVMYAAISLLMKQIVNMSSFRAKAGPVEFETQNAASTMTEMLKALRSSKARLLEDLRDAGSTTSSVVLIDAYSVRELRNAGLDPVLLGAV